MSTNDKFDETYNDIRDALAIARLVEISLGELRERMGGQECVSDIAYLGYSVAVVRGRLDRALGVIDELQSKFRRAA